MIEFLLLLILACLLFGGEAVRSALGFVLLLIFVLVGLALCSGGEGEQRQGMEEVTGAQRITGAVVIGRESGRNSLPEMAR